MAVTWVFLLRLVPGAQSAAGGVLAAGVPVFRTGAMAGPGRFWLPVTWVFSLYVGQAGSARR